MERDKDDAKKSRGPQPPKGRDELHRFQAQNQSSEELSQEQFQEQQVSRQSTELQGETALSFAATPDTSKEIPRDDWKLSFEKFKGKHSDKRIGYKTWQEKRTDLGIAPRGSKANSLRNEFYPPEDRAGSEAYNSAVIDQSDKKITRDDLTRIRRLANDGKINLDTMTGENFDALTPNERALLKRLFSYASLNVREALEQRLGKSRVEPKNKGRGSQKKLPKEKEKKKLIDMDPSRTRGFGAWRVGDLISGPGAESSIASSAMAPAQQAVQERLQDVFDGTQREEDNQRSHGGRALKEGLNIYDAREAEAAHRPNEGPRRVDTSVSQAIESEFATSLNASKGENRKDSFRQAIRDFIRDRVKNGISYSKIGLELDQDPIVISKFNNDPDYKGHLILKPIYRHVVYGNLKSKDEPATRLILALTSSPAKQLSLAEPPMRELRPKLAFNDDSMIQFPAEKRDTMGNASGEVSERAATDSVLSGLSSVPADFMEIDSDEMMQSESRGETPVSSRRVLREDEIKKEHEIESDSTDFEELIPVRRSHGNTRIAVLSRSDIFSMDVEDGRKGEALPGVQPFIYLSQQQNQIDDKSCTFVVAHVTDPSKVAEDFQKTSTPQHCADDVEVHWVSLYGSEEIMRGLSSLDFKTQKSKTEFIKKSENNIKSQVLYSRFDDPSPYDKLDVLPVQENEFSPNERKYIDFSKAPLGLYASLDPKQWPTVDNGEVILLGGSLGTAEEIEEFHDELYGERSKDYQCEVTAYDVPTDRVLTQKEFENKRKASLVRRKGTQNERMIFKELLPSGIPKNEDAYLRKSGSTWQVLVGEKYQPVALSEEAAVDAAKLPKAYKEKSLCVSPYGNPKYKWQFTNTSVDIAFLACLKKDDPHFNEIIGKTRKPEASLVRLIPAAKKDGSVTIQDPGSIQDLKDVLKEQMPEYDFSGISSWKATNDSAGYDFVPNRALEVLPAGVESVRLGLKLVPKSILDRAREIIITDRRGKKIGLLSANDPLHDFAWEQLDEQKEISYNDALISGQIVKAQMGISSGGKFQIVPINFLAFRQENMEKSLKIMQKRMGERSFDKLQLFITYGDEYLKKMHGMQMLPVFKRETSPQQSCIPEASSIRSSLETDHEFEGAATSRQGGNRQQRREGTSSQPTSLRGTGQAPQKRPAPAIELERRKQKTRGAGSIASVRASEELADSSLLGLEGPLFVTRDPPPPKGRFAPVSGPSSTAVPSGMRSHRGPTNEEGGSVDRAKAPMTSGGLRAHSDAEQGAAAAAAILGQAQARLSAMARGIGRGGGRGNGGRV
jgi:hypothetical protein